MKNCFSSIIGAVVGYVRRRPLDALYRRTRENGMWKAELPDFLDSNRSRLPEALGKGGGDALDAPVDVGAADGRMCFMRDGVRVVCLGPRE
jgi:hypothetical protein